jgi:Protein of unknown function (DUF1759)
MACPRCKQPDNASMVKCVRCKKKYHTICCVFPHPHTNAKNWECMSCLGLFVATPQHSTATTTSTSSAPVTTTSQIFGTSASTATSVNVLAPVSTAFSSWTSATIVPATTTVTISVPTTASIVVQSSPSTPVTVTTSVPQTSSPQGPQQQETVPFATESTLASQVKDLVKQDRLNQKALQSLQKNVQRQKEIIDDLTARLQQEESRRTQQDAREASLLLREQELRKEQEKLAAERAQTHQPRNDSLHSCTSSDEEEEDPQTTILRLKQIQEKMRTEIDTLKSSTPLNPIGISTDPLNAFVTVLNAVASSLGSQQTAPQPSPVDSLVLTMKQKMLLNLPKFDGALREWAFFEREYNRTTELGEFSPEQNIVRLRAALSGNAYDLVRDKILYSCDPDPVMASLKQTFGDSNRLVVVLTDELVKMPKIESETSEKLRKFALAVSNYVVNMRAINREGELQSTFTLTVLEEKLSYWHRCQWIEIKRAKETVNIEDLSNFLTQKMTDIPYIESTQLLPEPSRARRVHAHHHSGADSEGDDHSSQCAGCDGNHHLIRCTEFKKLSLNQKLDFVLENGICVSCLNAKHLAGDCPDLKKCEFDRCRFSHHKLLHGAKSKNYFKRIDESSDRSADSDSLESS